MNKPYLLAFLGSCMLLFMAACALTPENQEADNQLVAQLEQVNQTQVESNEALASLAATVAQIEAEKAMASMEGDEERELALKYQLEEMAAQQEAVLATLAALQAQEDDLDKQRDLLKSKDSGQQLGGWMQLLAGVLGVGGISLGAKANSAVNHAKELPSRASGEIAKLQEKLAGIEAMVAAFQQGMNQPYVPPPQPPHSTFVHPSPATNVTIGDPPA